jgi:hypothetical protein
MSSKTIKKIPVKETIKQKYVEKEAQHSESDSEQESSSNSEQESDSMDDFIDDDEDESSKTIASKSHSKNSESSKKSNRDIKVIEDSEDDVKPSSKRVKVDEPKKSSTTNATITKLTKEDESKLKKPVFIPSKPSVSTLKIEKKKNYDFRITITNGQNFLRFMLPVANAVNEMRFNLAMTPTFTGLRLEAHDTCKTLANISKFDCDIDPGVSQDGKVLSKEEISEITFCVATKTFMQTMNCSVLKEAVLTITRYNDKNSDALTFESSSNEDDVRAVYSCTLLDQASHDRLQFSINLNFHVTVELKTLKELSQNAKKCGAASIRFEVFQRVDTHDDSIVHSKMSIGFKSGSTSGSHGFYHSAKKAIRNGVVEWTSIPGASHTQEGMEQKCNNSYDISKLRTFLSHMDCEWALIHLPDDNTEQPLVIECDLGGPNTKHMIIISPNLADAE